MRAKINNRVFNIKMLFVLLSCILCLLLVGCSKKNKSGLWVETIFEIANYDLTNKELRAVKKFEEIARKTDFMTLYREVYRQLVQRTTGDFSIRLAAAVVLLKASQDSSLTTGKKNSAVRLFINFCRSSLIEAEFAIKFNQFAIKQNLFSNSDLKAYWKNYLMTVFGKRVKPNIKEGVELEGINLEFIKLDPDFVKEAKMIIHPVRHDIVKFEYILKPGVDPDNTEEDDYILKEIVIKAND